MKALPVLLAAGALAACAVDPAPLGPPPTAPMGVPLSSFQVRDEVVNKTLTGRRTGTNLNWTFYVGPDGALTTRTATGFENGRWRILDNGQFCMTWQVDFGGQETCLIASRMGQIVQLSAPTFRAEMQVLPGRQI